MWFVQLFILIFYTYYSLQTKNTSWLTVLMLHTYMSFHFINPGKPLGFGYETCPQDLADTIRHAQINTYTHTKQTIKSTH